MMRKWGALIAYRVLKSLYAISGSTAGWLPLVRESYPGAWQRNVEIEAPSSLLTFSAIYACVSIISDDISKLRIKLLRYRNGVWNEVGGTDNSWSPYLAVLRKPNPYQTRIQFLAYWIICKLLYGNVYIFKQRDTRGVVVRLYPLDPRRVTPLIADNGDIYYRLSRDLLSNIEEDLPVPASEIIHDRITTLWHPLVGVSPITACGVSGTQGLKIQQNSSKFFANMSRPSGQLTAPGPISDETALRLKAEFERNFSGENIGRLLVTGDGLRYEPMTIPPNDAQLIEQLKWTVEDVARCFKMPLYKLGLGQPTLSNVGALNQDYYNQTLQHLIESIELLLDEGLALPADLGTELDLEGLLRMDPLSRSDRNEKAIRAGYLTPNEARESENLPPVTGGDTPYLQQQNFSLSALARRDAMDNPFAPAPSPEPKPEAEEENEEEEDDDDSTEEFAAALVARIKEATAHVTY